MTFALGAVSGAGGTAFAQEKPEERSTGLPAGGDFKFGFDTGWGGFGFGNSLYNDPKEGVRENYGSRWMEGFIKPSLSAVVKLSSSEIYGKASAVGERTYSGQRPPELVGPEMSSFLPEDLAIGWRSGKLLAAGENALDFSFGRAPFQLGHGFLLWDGAAEGGSRGGYWSNARKAFGMAAIGRFKAAHHTVEGFYLKKDELPEHKTGTRLAGANYEFRLGEESTFGATYMKFHADPIMAPQRNNLDVYNVRAYTAPIPSAKDLSFELEYAAERNGDALHADAYTGLGAYQFSGVAWKPKISYRYAHFQGDDPATSRNEAFDPLLLGFSDWGTWWQGEIAGEYFLSNSNLDSHQARLHLTPNDKIGGGLIFFDFLLDHPASYAPGVTDRHVATELDGYADWKFNKNFTVSFILAFADPGKAVEQSINRTQSFRYGMVYIAYSY